MKNKITLLFCFTVILLISLFHSQIYSQDSTSVHSKLKELTRRVDSLEVILSKNNLDSLHTVSAFKPNKNEVATDSLNNDFLSSVTSFLSFEDQAQSSKRKRIDELLNELKNQPGVINLNGNATSIIQWKTGDKHFTNGSGSFDLFAFVGFENHTNLFIDLEAIGGDGPNNRIYSFATLNGDAGSLQDSDGRDLLHVREVWSEFNFFSGLLKVTMGKIDLTNYFDLNDAANDETLQFISGPFINSSAFPVPSNSPGMRAIVGIENLLTFQFGLVSHDNSGKDLFSNLFKIIGTELKADFGKGFYGNINLFAYKDGIISDASGYGISASGKVANLFKLFGRWNSNNPKYEQVFEIKDAWSIGTEFSSILFQQPLVFGVAYGSTKPYSVLLNNEIITEAYFRYQFNDWVYLSPHIQYIDKAGGLSDGYLLAAIRTQINF